MRDDIKQTIETYYQNRIPLTRALFFDTPEYRRYIQKKVEAEKDPAAWKEFIRCIKARFPEYSVNDFTHLGKDAGFFLQILLHPALEYEMGEDLLLEKTGGMLRQMHVFVSSLGPFFYYYIFEMCCKDKSIGNFTFNTISDSDYSKIEESMGEFISEFWHQKGCRLLAKEEVTEPVAGFHHDELYFTGSVLNFLFTTADNIED